MYINKKAPQNYIASVRKLLYKEVPAIMAIYSGTCLVCHPTTETVSSNRKEI